MTMFWSVWLPLGFFMIYAIVLLTHTIAKVLIIPKCRRCGKKTTPPSLDSPYYPCWKCSVVLELVIIDGETMWRESRITE